MRLLAAVPAIVVVVLVGACPAGAQDPPAPPAAPPPPPPSSVIESLPERVLTPPRVEQAPLPGGTETITLALRREVETLDVPYATTVETAEDIRERRNARNLPDALLRLPSTVVQKTGAGQSSPFIRGFTGYHNLMLIDGVRLNHSALRSGPNQYWSTVDAYTVGRLEVARGPHSVLWGSDAVGGAVYVVPRRRECFAPGLHLGGGVFTRYAGAEDAIFVRAEVEGNSGPLGWLGGVTWRNYGDLTSGAGKLPYTAYDEYSADLRLDRRLSACATLTLAAQHVRQDDVPRTHSTIFAVPFAGSTVGTELRRELDQSRDLVYARLEWEGAGGLFPSGHALLSWQRQDELQVRERTGGRVDRSSFRVDTLGAAVQLERPMGCTVLTVGADAWHDEVDSARDNFLAGAYTGSEVQGPLGDDAAYDLVGVYAQLSWRCGRWEWIPGLRFTYAAADAQRVDNPLVAGSNPATPGNVIAVEDDWTALVGSVRAVYRAGPCWNLYGGLSQAFRAPSLSDLTAFESTSVVETPAPDLDPDRYLGAELGAKTEQRNLSGNVALWALRLDDTIVRSPTGALISGVPEVRKDNVGDGWLWGVEVEAAWRLHPCWTVLGNAWWMDGEVDQLDAALVKRRHHFDRLPPFTSLLGLRYEPPRGRAWAQLEWVHAGKADRLSFQNETDTQRIPPGGTPGYDVLHLRAGYRLSRHADLLAALENLTDENYRIHGSGLNEPGFNVVLGLDLRW